MKRTVSICLLSVFLALFGMTLETKAQGGCCLWMENVDPTMPAWQAATLKAPSYHGVDVYEVKFSNGCALDLNSKISLAWTLTRDGEVLNLTQQELEMYVKIKLETTYAPIGRLGGYLHNGISYKRVPGVNGTTLLSYQDYPGALSGSQLGGPDHGYWHFANDVYHYDYIYLHYFMASHTYVTLEWVQPGDYTLSVSMVGRTLGTDWSDQYYDATQTMVLGGHLSTVVDTIATFELKPVTEVAVDTLVCRSELPFALGRPPIEFHGDTTGAMVALWIDEACHLIDTVLNLTLTTIDADTAPHDTLFYFCKDETPSGIDVVTIANHIVEWSVDKVNWTDTIPVPSTDVVGIDTLYVHQGDPLANPLCFSEAAIVQIVTLAPTPSLGINGNNIEVCQGDSLLPLNQPPTVTPDYFVEYSLDNINWVVEMTLPTGIANTFNLYVRQTDTLGVRRCPSSPSDTVIVFVKHLPIFTMIEPNPNDSVCEGSNIEVAFTTIPANTVRTWIPADATINDVASGTAEVTVSMILNKPAGTYWYTAHVTDFETGCVINDTIRLTWNPLPTPEIILLDTNLVGGVCERDTARMTTAIHYTTYEWKFNGVFISTEDTIVIDQTGRYTVYVTDEVGCEGRDTLDLVLDPLPLVDLILPVIPDICSGAPTDIEIICTSCPAFSYLWNTTGTSNPETVVVENNTNSPLDTTFTVTITDIATGCKLDTSKLLIVHPNPIAIINPIDGVVACKNEPLSFNGSDDRDYTDTTSITFAWTATNGSPLSSTDTNFVVQFANPTITTPEMVTLTITNNWGCVNSDTTRVTVQDSVLLAISTTKDPICQGDSANLTVYLPNPADAANYPIASVLWSEGGETTASIWVKPTVTTTYTATVTCTDRKCPSIASITITVNPIPEVTIGSDPVLPLPVDTVCYMSTVRLWANLLNGTGGVPSDYDYLWSGYVTSTSDTVTVVADHPGEIMEFNVVVTNKITGCLSITRKFVYVRPQVAPSLVLYRAPNTNACSGKTVSVYSNVAPAGYNFLWTTGGETTDTLRVAMTTLVDNDTTVYLTITDIATGCTNSANMKITFYPLPVINITPALDSICYGDSYIITVNTGHSAYLWSTGAIDNNQTTITHPVTASTDVFVTVYSNRGCVQDTVAHIEVIPTPDNTITPDPCENVFEGETVTLTAVNATVAPFNDFLWSNGSSADTMQFVAATTSTYYVTITENYTTQHCTVVGEIEITVDPLTSHNLLREFENCSGADTLIGFDETDYNYVWSNSETTNLINVAPTNTTTYYVSISKDGGCYTRLDSITVTVLPLPDITLVLVPCDSVLEGTNVTITAVNDVDYTYAWSNGETTYEIVVAPDTTTAYSLTITNSITGCQNDTTFIIGVYPVTPIGDGRDVENCAGVDIVIGFAETDYTYLWSTTETTPTITVAPLVTTPYYVTISKPGSCAADKLDSIVVTVQKLPVDIIETYPLPVTTVCQNEELILALTDNEVDPEAPRTIGDWYAVEVGTSTPVHYFQTDGDTLHLNRLDTLPAGQYYFMVDLTNALGCSITDTIELEIVAKPLIDAPAATFRSVCSGEIVTLDFLNSTDFSPTNLNYFNISTTSSKGHNVSVQIVYAPNYSMYDPKVTEAAFYANDGIADTVIVTTIIRNTAGCETVRKDTILFNPLPLIDAIAIEGNAFGNFTVCGADEATLFVNYVAGYTYSWYGGSLDSNLFVIDVTTPGTYYDTLVVTTPAGCTVTLTVIIEKVDIPEVSITSPSIYLNDTTLAIECLNPIDLTATVTNAAPSTTYTFDWTNGAGTLLRSNIDPTTDMYQYSTHGRDTITVTVTDNNTGCQVSESQIVIIDSMPLIDIASITPDGSTVNYLMTPGGYTAIYEKDGQTGDAIKYEVIVNKRCWEGYNKVVLNFAITDAAGNPVVYDSMFSAVNSVTYRFNNMVGDYNTFTNYNNQPSATFHENETYGSLPMGGGGTPASNERYILNNLPYNWLYLHFLDQRPMTVVNNYIKKAGDYTITYTLVEYFEDHALNQHNIQYGPGTPLRYVGGGASLTGSSRVIATRQIVLHITGDDMIPNAIETPAILANGVKPTANVYPNPAQEEVNIEVKGVDGVATFGIYDLNGRLINQFEANVTNGQVINHNVSTYSDGVYFIKITTNEAIINKKLVITK